MSDRRLELLDVLGITEDMLVKVVEGRATMDYHERVGSHVPFDYFMRNMHDNNTPYVEDTKSKPGSPVNLSELYGLHKIDKTTHGDTNGDIDVSLNSDTNSTDNDEAGKTDIINMTKGDDDINDLPFGSDAEYKKDNWKLDTEEDLEFDLDKSSAGWTEVQTEAIAEVGVIEVKGDNVKTPTKNTTSGSEDTDKTTSSGGWGTTPVFDRSGEPNTTSVSSPNDWMKNPWETKK